MNKDLIERIATMLNEGMSVELVQEILAEEEQDHFDSLAADAEDDSDAAIERRYRISPDDRFDSRGEALRPAVNEAGEPWWM
jgi:DNA-binding transcriptional MerR regulator